jgi:hypothetical protein
MLLKYRQHPAPDDLARLPSRSPLLKRATGYAECGAGLRDADALDVLV